MKHVTVASQNLRVETDTGNGGRLCSAQSSWAEALEVLDMPRVGERQE